MNKYQKRIDKLTKRYINLERYCFISDIERQEFFAKQFGKTIMQLKKMLQTNNLFSNNHYRKTRKKIRKNWYNKENFKREYKCKWLGVELYKYYFK